MLQDALAAMAAGKEFTIQVQPTMLGCASNGGSTGSGGSSNGGNQGRPVLTLLLKPADSGQLRESGMPHIAIPAWGAEFGGKQPPPAGSMNGASGAVASAQLGAAAGSINHTPAPPYYFAIVQPAPAASSAAGTHNADQTAGLSGMQQQVRQRVLVHPASPGRKGAAPQAAGWKPGRQPLLLLPAPADLLAACLLVCPLPAE
jgi:hypothetical protein